MPRQMNFQTMEWFWELHQSGRLDLDPPYQRRSVWTREYREFFIDTVLHGYPSPAIFLFYQSSPEGPSRSKYSVVDGKQRLTTLFDFASNQLAVARRAVDAELASRKFKDISNSYKENFWGYQFAVETLPSSDDRLIKDIFDRLNRNTAKLTEQELRHAQFEGIYLQETERMADVMAATLPSNFPNILPQQRRQMKDVEYTAELFLLLEKGPTGTAQADLDNAYRDRDEDWPQRESIVSRFQETIDVLSNLTQSERGPYIRRSRLKNQLDFYSLFGALDSLSQSNFQFAIGPTGDRLIHFAETVEDPAKRKRSKDIESYYEATRASTNDVGPRKARIDVMKKVLRGDLDDLILTPSS